MKKLFNHKLQIKNICNPQTEITLRGFTCSEEYPYRRRMTSVAI